MCVMPQDPACLLYADSGGYINFRIKDAKGVKRGLTPILFICCVIVALVDAEPLQCSA